MLDGMFPGGAPPSSPYLPPMTGSDPRLVFTHGTQATQNTTMNGKPAKSRMPLVFFFGALAGLIAAVILGPVMDVMDWNVGTTTTKVAKHAAAVEGARRLFLWPTPVVAARSGGSSKNEAERAAPEKARASTTSATAASTGTSATASKRPRTGASRATRGAKDDASPAGDLLSAGL